ncbi:unnamed protein product [Polarella glacialis]|uniref:Uncharacterized protein n=1 Tax=Polarella glacialis TaxID=89957 RepID=A0A813L6T6_POLGL|nr:unnamed protein product [Polarella glacialis]
MLTPAHSAASWYIGPSAVGSPPLGSSLGLLRAVRQQRSAFESVVVPAQTRNSIEQPNQRASCRRRASLLFAAAAGAAASVGLQSSLLRQQGIARAVDGNATGDVTEAAQAATQAAPLTRSTLITNMQTRLSNAKTGTPATSLVVTQQHGQLSSTSARHQQFICPDEALELSDAAAVVRKLCPRWWCQAALAVEGFLYRGETIASPTRRAPRPDLLDDVVGSGWACATYGAPGAAYFARLEQNLPKATNLPARARAPVPSRGHLCGDLRAASEWGPACSVWPLGETYYAWPRTGMVFWEPRTSQGIESKDLAINKGLAEAIQEHREAGLRCRPVWTRS